MRSFLKVHFLTFTLLLAAGVFYIPQLHLGYGVEEDSQTAVVTAHDAHVSGEYIMSRLPGHPAYEYLLRVLWPVHDWAYYGLNLVALLLSFIFLHKIISATIKNPERLRIIGALFLIPVMMTTLWETMEYQLALCMLIVSWWAASKQKYILASIVLALSVGFRLPNLIFGLPLFLMLGMNSNWKKAVFFALGTFLFSSLLYLPVYQAYGIEFFNTYSLPYPPLAKAAYKGTLGVWGVLGSKGIAVLVIGLPWKKLMHLALKKESIPFILSILFSILLYISLPEKSAFLLPFVVLIGSLCVWHTKKGFRDLGFLLIASSVLAFDVELIDENRGAPAEEATYVNSSFSQDVGVDFYGFMYPLKRAKALNKQRYTADLYNYLSALESPSYVVAGWWFPFLQVYELEGQFNINPNIEFVYYATEEQIEEAKSQGKSILFTPEADIYNEQKYGHGLLARYGQVINLDRQQ